MTQPLPTSAVFNAIRDRLGSALAPSPVGYNEIESFLTAYLPGIEAALEPLRQGFSWVKARAVVVAISQAVKDGLPLVKDQNAKLVVEALVTWVWRTYVVALLPVVLRPFQGLLLTLLIASIEALYQRYVKGS